MKNYVKILIVSTIALCLVVSIAKGGIYNPTDLSTYEGDVNVTGDMTVSGDLDVIGAFTLSGTVGTGGIDMNGEDLTMGDNAYLYFDTAKSEYIRYSSDHMGLVFYSAGGLSSIGGTQYCSNTAADGSGNWEPLIDFGSTGILRIQNTTQGSVGSKYLEVDMTDGVKFNTGGAKDAFLLADNVTTADKTFQFPDVTGTLVTTAGAGAAINLGAYDLSVEGASGIIIGKDAATNTAGVLKLWSAGATDYYNTFTAGTNTANATYTLPVAMPASDKVLQSTSAGVLSWETAGGAGGTYGMNVETLSAGKTLTPNSDEIYQYLDEGGANRIITLATAGATAGDRFVVRHNGVYNDTHYLEVKQSATVKDYIYAGGIREFIYDGSNWIAGEEGSGESGNLNYNTAIGYKSNAYKGGVAIGKNTSAHDYGVAIGSDAEGYTYGIGIGSSADGANYGIAIGSLSDTNEKKYSIALGYKSETERTGEFSININGGDSDQENNIITQGWEITTANNTPVEMLAGGQSGERFTIRASSVVGFTMTIVARDNVAGHVAMYTIADGIIKRDAANNTAMAAAATVTVVHEDDASWDVAVTADDTNEALIITVTGDATNPTQWAARMDAVETHF